MLSNKDKYYFHMFLILIRAVYMNIEKECNIISEKYGLTAPQQHALWILRTNNGEIGLEQLAKQGLWNKSTASELVSRLEKKQLVMKYKEHNNNKYVFIRMTGEGEKALSASAQYGDYYSLVKAVSSYDEETLKSFIGFLYDICDKVGPFDLKDFKQRIADLPVRFGGESLNVED